MYHQRLNGIAPNCYGAKQPRGPASDEGLNARSPPTGLKTLCWATGHPANTALGAKRITGRRVLPRVPLKSKSRQTQAEARSNSDCLGTGGCVHSALGFLCGGMKMFFD